jgi:GNAT superfamily N-acetyltransferase
MTIAATENDESIIGLANISGREAGVVNLDLLAVDPGYQGKGLGSLLLAEAEKEAGKTGRGTMRLMTEQIKPRNVAFYSSRGYKVTGYDPRGYEHSPAIKFEKRISVKIP